jgi:hypothetical protein
VPHRDFDAARAERERKVDPVTFTLGGEDFSCVLAPSVGDAFDLADAPEPESSLIGSVRAITAFVDKILVVDDRQRFRELIRRVDTPHGPINSYDLIEQGSWVGEELSWTASAPVWPVKRNRSDSSGSPSPKPGSSSSHGRTG